MLNVGRCLLCDRRLPVAEIASESPITNDTPRICPTCTELPASARAYLRHQAIARVLHARR